MPNKTITLEFSEPKYNALKYFLGKEDRTIEKELQAHLDKLYQKTLSKDMQEYFSAMENEQSVQTAAPPSAPKTETPQITPAAAEQSSQTERSARPATRRQREAAVQTKQPSPVTSGMRQELEQAESQSKSMSMNM